tara:strand:+ start:78 stop:1331 length:1254 start_codon:yes stop_codon:yes gene_type:complete
MADGFALSGAMTNRWLYGPAPTAPSADVGAHSAAPATPLCAECEDEEEVDNEALVEARLRACEESAATVEDCKALVRGQPYLIRDNGWRLWWRVCCDNSAAYTEGEGDALPARHTHYPYYLGQTGHIERMNVYTHAVAAALYACYFAVRSARPWSVLTDASTSSGLLSLLAGWSLVFTFVCSTIYHVYSANPVLAAVARLLDYLGIYTSLVFCSLLDASITTLNLRGVHPNTVVDCVLGSVVLTLFFVYRRRMLRTEDTWKMTLGDQCSQGLVRFQHADLEHAGLRVSAGLVLAFQWTQFLPAAYENLELECAWFFAGAHVVGTAILVVGMAWDNMFVYPDAYVKEGGKALPGCCYSRGSKGQLCTGWILTSHALWHIISLASTVVTTVGTEYVISTSAVLAEASDSAALAGGKREL